MALNETEVLQVLEMFQKSGWQEMRLQSGSFRVSISKTGRAPTVVTEQAPRVAIPPVAAAPASATPTKPVAPTLDPRWVAVKAPLLGNFYSAPKPGAPPFVSLGQQVTAGDTVAILEVMKLMNHVKAGVAGRIVRIAVANGDLVEFDQALIYIDPAA